MNKTDAFVESITQDIVGFLIMDRKIELEAAMNLFYNSVLFDKLHDIKTGLYLEGAAYVYELLKDEFSDMAG
jgi:hypothetical protein